MSQCSGKGDIESVVSGGYCVGCGACAVQDLDYRVRENEFGLYQAELIASSNSSALVSEVCPFSAKRNEGDLGRRLYGSDSRFDTRIGYYKEIYAGHVADGDFRKNGSSGGLVTWVLGRLFADGDIDGVIHVGEAGGAGGLFEYRISETLDDILGNSKSRYYPVHMDAVLQQVRQTSKKYAFIGVPCFVKAVRLLAENDADVAKNIKYCISIFCGHLKTKAFAEMIGWQQKVQPSELVGIDFRVKDEHRPANQYSVQVVKDDGVSTRKLAPVPARDLYGMDWGLGYFKPKACDWCDDIAGEVGDLACGDAWLPEFSHLPGGTNIAVVRDPRIFQLVNEGIEKGQLALTVQPVEKVYQSQAGNYRHRQEGLSVRVEQAVAQGIWHPRKRVAQDSFKVPGERRRIYELRMRIAEHSHIAFRQAKNRDSFLHFYLKMLPLELHYYFLSGSPLKGMAKSVYALAKYIRRK